MTGKNATQQCVCLADKGPGQNFMAIPKMQIYERHCAVTQPLLTSKTHIESRLITVVVLKIDDEWAKRGHHLPSHHTEPVFPPPPLRGSLLPFHLLPKPKERRLNYYALLYVFFLAVAVAEVCVGILQWRGEGGRCTMKVPVHKLKQLLLLSADCWELNE